MKPYLPLLAAALALAACSPQEPAPAPAEPAASAPSASAPEAAAASEQAAAPRCEVVVSSNDQMKFDTDAIHISRRCDSFTIHLKHVGTMPKAAMGHNIVIAKHEDIAAVVKDGAGAGADGDFVKAGDERIVAHTKLIGGGEETSLSLNPAKLAEGDYRFVCSFPGHEGLMNGKVVLVD